MPEINRTGDVKSKIINVDFKCSGSDRVIIRFPRRRRTSIPQCDPQASPLTLPAVPSNNSTPEAFAKALLVKTTALACTAASALTGHEELPHNVLAMWATV